MLTKTEIINQAKEELCDSGFEYVSPEFIANLLPENIFSFAQTDLQHVKVVADHELQVLHEFMQLANDKLCEIAGENFTIAIIHNNLIY